MIDTFTDNDEDENEDERDTTKLDEADEILIMDDNVLAACDCDCDCDEEDPPPPHPTRKAIITDASNLPVLTEALKIADLE